MPVGANFDPYFFKNSFVETLKVVSSNPATHQRHIAILACCEPCELSELFVARDHWPEPLTHALVIKNDVRQQSITPSNYYLLLLTSSSRAGLSGVLLTPEICLYSLFFPSSLRAATGGRSARSEAHHPLSMVDLLPRQELPHAAPRIKRPTSLPSPSAFFFSLFFSLFLFLFLLLLFNIGQQSWFIGSHADSKNFYILLFLRSLSPFSFFLSPCSFGGQRLHCLRPVAFAFKRWRSPLPRPEAPANQIICVGS